MLEDNEISSMRKVRNELIEECGSYCWCCGRFLDASELQGHHIIPQAQGGKTMKSNIALLCANCHKKKHDLINHGQWKQYNKSMNAIRYNGKEFQKMYQAFLAST